MNNKNPVMKIQNISFKKHLSKLIYKNITLELQQGEMLFLKMDTAKDVSNFGDLTSMLIPPLDGRIFFDGKDLNTLPSSLKEESRYYIKRVFEGKGFISNLTIAKNIMLSELHHTKRKEKDIQEEIIKLSQIFDITDIFNLRPFRCSKLHLKLAQWIRALSGTSKLIILEDPFTRDNMKNQLLFDILNEKVKTGISVIWLLHSMYKYKILEAENIEIIDFNQNFRDLGNQ